jgi:hypothetical protein
LNHPSPPRRFTVAMIACHRSGVSGRRSALIQVICTCPILPKEPMVTTTNLPTKRILHDSTSSKFAAPLKAASNQVVMPIRFA